jgi:D-beta-D-heptose 7-phosphate kinase/D-beta-D-heptose 1-phosphate adenosyltransferase
MINIFTNGCFDIIHVGHIELLKYAKSLGDKLIVGLNSDNSIKTLKGKSRPINFQEDRKKILESIKYVDEVIIFDELTPIELIKKVKPNVIVKGGDYKKENVIGYGLSEVIIFNYLNGYSTTKTIKNISDGRLL